MPRLNSRQAIKRFSKPIICSNILFLITPPPDGSFNAPIIHKINVLYQNIYWLGKCINKRDYFGIWIKVENICLEILEYSLTAALKPKTLKFSFLENSKIKIEILKYLIRNCSESKIIEDKHYLLLIKQLEEISKMTAGWIKFLQ